MKYDLTVGIPVYNEYPYVKVAIESILNQTIKGFDILIINDGSTDETVDYLKNLKSENHRIRIINQENKGIGCTRTVILENLKTKYLVNMDADDFSLPERLEILYKFMEENREIGACGSFVEYFHQSQEISGYPPPLPTTHDDIVKKLVKIQHGMVFPSLIVRTKVAKKTGGFVIDGVGEDWDFMLKIGKISKLANVNEMIYKMRIHKTSLSSTNWEECRLKNKFASYNFQKNEEITFQQFEKSMFNSLVKKYLWKISTYVNLIFIKFYRKGIVAGLRSRKIKSKIYFILASLCAPNKLLKRLFLIFKK